MANVHNYSFFATQYNHHSKKIKSNMKMSIVGIVLLEALILTPTAVGKLGVEGNRIGSSMRNQKQAHTFELPKHDPELQRKLRKGPMGKEPKGDDKIEIESKKKDKEDKKCRSKSKNEKGKGKKKKDCGFAFDATCYSLFENETMPMVNVTDRDECKGMTEPFFALADSSFVRENFDSYFQEFLRPGVEQFIADGLPNGTTITVNYDEVSARLEAFFFDNITLGLDDFDELLSFYNRSTSITNRQQMLSDEGNDGDVTTATAFVSSHAIVPYEAMHPSDEHQSLIGDDDLSPECIALIIRIVLEVVGLILSAFGVRSVVTRPFKEYIIVVKGGQLNGLVIQAYRQSRGVFDVTFFVGLMDAFLAIMRWDDIKNALSGIPSEDWWSLALGLTFAIASVFATGGVALALAIASVALNGYGLATDIAKLDECFALCSDGLSQSGGQQTTTYIVLLDRSKGKLTLSYNMYSVPDQLDLIYEGATIFTTGGLVSGSSTISREIDGDAKEILVRITAPNSGITVPNSGTAWNFQLVCPVPDIL